MDRYHSPEMIRHIGDLTAAILSDYYSQSDNRSVSAFSDKGALIAEFFESSAPESGQDLDRVLEYFREQVLPNSVKTWHPLYLNQMSPGASYPAILGDLLASMMNPTLSTWEAAPVATLIERAVSGWLAQILGMPPGSSGIFLPGGSIANLLGLAVARNHALGGEAKQSGLRRCAPVAVLSSDGCHYSVMNAVNLLGIGLDQWSKVKTNGRNEMLPEDLERNILQLEEHGIKPLAVVATLGTTITGGFDPLSEIAAICKPRGIHLHVDAAFGGILALTSQGKSFFKGIELADTVVWDAHKGLNTPLACSALLVPDPQVLKRSFNPHADYLFHQQIEEEPQSDDLGLYTILCGKKFESLKLWMMFKTFGLSYFRQYAESRLRLVHQIYQALAADPDFEPSYPPISPVQCFRFLPAELPKTDDAYLDQMHLYIRNSVMSQNLALFNIATHKGRQHFRMVLVNPLTEIGHITPLLDKIREIGRAYIVAHPPMQATISQA